jgi:hypothetical protein
MRVKILLRGAGREWNGAASSFLNRHKQVLVLAQANGGLAVVSIADSTSGNNNLGIEAGGLTQQSVCQTGNPNELGRGIQATASRLTSSAGT